MLAGEPKIPREDARNAASGRRPLAGGLECGLTERVTVKNAFIALIE
jgi:hypothetical protein